MSQGSVGIVKPQLMQFDEPIELKGGQRIDSYEIAFETYGELNAARDNAILVCHALNASHHVAGIYEDEPSNVGWWDNLIGPGSTASIILPQLAEGVHLNLLTKAAL